MRLGNSNESNSGTAKTVTATVGIINSNDSKWDQATVMTAKTLQQWDQATIMTKWDQAIVMTASGTKQQ